jgi:protein-tyrosine phosphatase
MAVTGIADVAPGTAPAVIAAERGDTGAMAAPLRILCVCTFNQTRSLLMGVLLASHLRATSTPHRIITAGTEVQNPRPATERTVRLLAKRGVDVTSHRSRRVDEPLVNGAHLIVTAEPAHVVWITGRWPAMFERTFTLPELVTLAEDAQPEPGEPIDQWLVDVGLRRTPMVEYLDADSTGEIADPTGQSPSVWNSSFATIDDLTERLARTLRQVSAPAKGVHDERRRA